MKKLGFMILHQGFPYIRAAVESVYKQVDKIIILYAEKPSQGHRTDVPCPDSEGSLQREVSLFNDKIEWVRGDWTMEGQHVGAIEYYAEGYDWVWRFDSDEIVPPGMIDAMITQAEKESVKRYLVPFQHFWRCFNKVNIDGQCPVRLFNPKGEEGEKTLDSEGKWRVCHMGYAIPDVYMRYKWEISGHKPELRPEWFKEVWEANSQENCHPVAHGLWPHTQDFDKTTLPNALKRHKYYNQEFIQ